MTFKDLKAKWDKLVRDLNEKGIPIPMLRDPKTKMSSVSLTLMGAAFGMWLIGVIGKVSGLLDGVDVDSAFNMFIATASLYFGRRLKSDNGKMELEDLRKSEDK